MRLFRVVLPLWVVICLPAWLDAQAKKSGDEPSMQVAQGQVDKADKDTLVVKPRGANGQFQKAISLRLTGTSKVTVLTPQKRGDKMVFTQRDGEAKDLVAGQAIAVIYAEVGKEGPALLSAVVQSAGK